MTKPPDIPRPPRKAARVVKAAGSPGAQPGPEAESPTPAADTSPYAPRLNKTDVVIAMLRTPAGASVDEMMATTGWQRHSVRGALAGAVKKKLGAAITSEVIDGVRRYRAPEAAA